VNNEWIRKLKVGDCVIAPGSALLSPGSLVVVKHLTKTQIVTRVVGGTERRWRRDDGISLVSYWRSGLQEANAANRRKLYHAQLHFWFRGIATRLEVEGGSPVMLSYVALTEIKAIVDKEFPLKG